MRWGIVQATGIFAVSVSGHSCLPAIRNSMSEPQRFNSVLNLAFTVRLRTQQPAFLIPSHGSMHVCAVFIRSIQL